MSQIQIPKAWELKKLENVSKLVSGNGFPREYQNVVDKGIPFIKVEDMNSQGNEKFIFKSNFYVNEEIIKKIKAKKYPKGTIIFPKIGGAILTNKKRILTEESCFDNNVMGLISNQQILSEFLYKFILNLDLKKFIKNGPVPSIDTKKLAHSSILVPPKEIQKKINQKLDYILGQLEGKKKEILELTQKNLNLVKHLKENLLISFINKLIPRDNLKEGWSMIPLSKVCQVERGKFGHRPRNDPDYYGGKYPFIQTGDIARSDGRIKTFSQTLNEKGFKVSRMFPKGTVVITIAANIGDTAILEFDCCFPDSIIGITPFEGKAIPEYIEYSLRLYQNDLSRDASKGAQKNINYGFLKPLEIPIPPDLDSQREIVKKIKDAEYELNATRNYFEKFEEKQNKMITYLNHLQNSVLEQAFSGKLVN